MGALIWMRATRAAALKSAERAQANWSVAEPQRAAPAECEVDVALMAGSDERTQTIGSRMERGWPADACFFRLHPLGTLRTTSARQNRAFNATFTARGDPGVRFVLLSEYWK